MPALRRLACGFSRGPANQALQYEEICTEWSLVYKFGTVCTHRLRSTRMRRRRFQCPLKAVRRLIDRWPRFSIFDKVSGRGFLRNAEAPKTPGRSASGRRLSPDNLRVAIALRGRNKRSVLLSESPAAAETRP